MLRIALRAFGALLLSAVAVWWVMDDRRGVGWAVAYVRARFRDVTHLPVETMRQWVRDPHRTQPQWLDSRSEAEFAVSHLPGAIRADYRTLSPSLRAALDSTRPIVVYCSAGYRASVLARQLQRAGFREVANLEGGIFAWANAGGPLERAGQAVEAVHPYLPIFSRMVRRRSGVVSS